MFLDESRLKTHKISSGNLGIGGHLGYFPHYVYVWGKYYDHAISAAPPSHISCPVVDAHFFACDVALNDTSAPGSSANFLVYADDLLVAVAENVQHGERPRNLSAILEGASKIDLVVEASDPQDCHAVWLNPFVDRTPLSKLKGPLGVCRANIPSKIPSCETCIFTLVNPAYVGFADDMLGSLYTHGNVKEATIVLFVYENSPAIERLAKKYNAQIIECFTDRKNTLIFKTMVYSVAQLFHADEYLFLDVDMLILKDISNVFSIIRSCNKRSIVICREAGLADESLGELLTGGIKPYWGNEGDIAVLGFNDHEFNFKFIVNTGVFGGSRRAMLALDNMMRSMMPGAAAWEACNHVDYREQAVFNLALARLKNYTELSEIYNMQLQHHVADFQTIQDGLVEATCEDKPVCVIHFNGPKGKDQYKVVSGLYRGVDNPKFAHVEDHAFASFIKNVQDYMKHSGPHSNAASPDSILNTKYILQALYQRVVSNKYVDILTLDIGNAITTCCLASAAVENCGTVLALDATENAKGTALIQSFPEAIRDRMAIETTDVLTRMKGLFDLNYKFNCVFMDTAHNDRRVLAEAMLALSMLEDAGELIIYDIDYPLCNGDILIQKLKNEGYAPQVLQISNGNGRRLIGVPCKKFV